ncbi:AI-2E family transporter [Micromonospora sp. CPCC 206061]|uniref:AI-2E family transporter n=1 Tax=Micromonospora sp. CPCC 206061 TaxID=3122410 RepID=UPI002FF3A5D8
MSDVPDRSPAVWRAIPWPLRYAAVSSACVLLVAATAYLALRLAAALAPLTLAVVAALLLTALLEPLVAVLDRLRVPRPLAALGGALALPGLLPGAGILMWQALAPQLADLPGQLERGWTRTRDWLVTGPLGISAERLDEVERQAAEYARDAVASPATFAPTVIEFLAAALLALVLVFFLLKDGPGIARWLVSQVPEGSRPRAAAAAREAWRTLGQYARGTVVIAAVDAVGIGIALVVIGVPFALPLALVTFLAAFVPIVGATVAGVLAALVALASNGPVDALLTLAAVIAVQQAEGNLLEPLIMGRSLRLHPAVVLVAVTAGTLSAGIAGALVAVPLTAVVYKAGSTLIGEARPPDQARGG